MLPCWGMSKKTSAQRRVAVDVIMLLTGILSGCGNINSIDKQPTSNLGGN